MEVAVLGAGNGGCAAAADLTRRGFRVRVYSRSAKTLRPIQELGGLNYIGVIGEGFAPIELVTTDIARAVKGADVVMVVAPMLAHVNIAGALAPHLQPEQMLLVAPGHTAVNIARILRENGVANPTICGTSTLPYAARLVAPATVRVSLEVRRLFFAAFPGRQTDAYFSRMAELYPSASPVANVLETMFRYMNAIHHPVTTLCNIGRIESTHGDFFHYYDGITPAVGRLIDELDTERIAIASSIGVPTQTFIDYFHDIGYTTTAAWEIGTAYEAFHQSEANRQIKAPTSLEHRYFEEDVPYGLVPLAHIGRLAAVPTRTMDSVIYLASIIKGVDYMTQGLTLERMGLSGIGVDRLLWTLRDGFPSER